MFFPEEKNPEYIHPSDILGMVVATLIPRGSDVELLPPTRWMGR